MIPQRLKVKARKREEEAEICPLNMVNQIKEEKEISAEKEEVQAPEEEEGDNKNK